MEADLADLGRLFGGILVVPVLKVLVHRGRLCRAVFLHHGQEVRLLTRRRPVHGLVEGGIAGVVLCLETLRTGHGKEWA